jgi:glutathione synthase/RimK-type ligase-like ATP-grasp enzyme
VYLNGKSLEELDFFRKLSLQGRKKGIEVCVFTSEDVDHEKASIRALIYDDRRSQWIRKWTSIPALIYDRCRYRSPVQYHEVKAFRARYPELLYLGRPLANKWDIYQALSENERIKPHLPDTIKYSGVKETIQFLKKHKVIYLKPQKGTGGRGILRIEQIGGGRYLFQGRDQNRAILAPVQTSEQQLSVKLNALNLSDQYLVQQGINLTLKDGRVHDFRLLIQKNGSGEWEITGCAGRVGAKRSVTSNLHGGGSAVPMEKLLQQRFKSASQIESIIQSVSLLGLEAGKYLEGKYGLLCELGIDIAVDPKGQVWLLEVNPKPSREVFKRIGEYQTYRKAISRPLEYALWLMQEIQKRAD